MAVFKIFPQKDTYISELKPNNNYGRDEILELSSSPKNNSRILIKFPLNILNDISSSFSSSLKLYMANAYNLQENLDIHIYPLSQSWEMGTGRNGDEPNPQNGSSWNYPTSNTSSLWDYWDTIPSIYKISQSFNYQDIKDINCDITPIVNGWFNNNIENHGLLIKFPMNIESSSINNKINFFSLDTHTIYPPHIDIIWDDIIYSSSIPIINNNNFQTTIINNKGYYDNKSIYTFRLYNRDLYPIRNFQTSSLYLNNKILPENSYWALRDIKTEEMVVNFNILGTKIGADDISNYFNIYMDGLEPERYYQIIIKSEIDNNIIIIDDKSNYFKINK